MQITPKGIYVVCRCKELAAELGGEPHEHMTAAIDEYERRVAAGELPAGSDD